MAASSGAWASSGTESPDEELKKREMEMKMWKTRGVGGYANMILKVKPLSATEFEEGGVVIGIEQVDDDFGVCEFLLNPTEVSSLVCFAKCSSAGANIIFCDESNEGVELTRCADGLKVNVFCRRGMRVCMVGSSDLNALAMGLESVMGRIMFGE